MYHNPVMLQESLQGLAINPSGIYVDATFGGGGHSNAILQHLDSHGKLIAFDQDSDARQNVPGDERVIFVNHNFRYMHNFLKLYNMLPADGILADLGVSSYQFDESSRGFSTRFEGPLDMRMDKSAALSAKEVINNYEAQDLERIFFLYGELPQSRKIVSAIEKERKNNPVETTQHLKEILIRFSPKAKENKFLAQVFQALRIEVNQELDALKEMLEQSVNILKPGGRLVIISYHSLEDRLVKNFMRSGKFFGEIEKDFFGNPLTPFQTIGKAISPSEEEIQSNNRARSARLRIAKKK
jgi:16S rRNA (cytosine1402-N4)-methyltransferase